MRCIDEFFSTRFDLTAGAAFVGWEEERKILLANMYNLYMLTRWAILVNSLLTSRIFSGLRSVCTSLKSCRTGETYVISKKKDGSQATATHMPHFAEVASQNFECAP